MSGPVRVARDAGVVACGQAGRPREAAARSSMASKRTSPLHFDARVGRAALGVAVEERVDHLARKRRAGRASGAGRHPVRERVRRLPPGASSTNAHRRWPGPTSSSVTATTSSPASRASWAAAADPRRRSWRRASGERSEQGSPRPPSRRSPTRGEARRRRSVAAWRLGTMAAERLAYPIRGDAGGVENGLSLDELHDRAARGPPRRSPRRRSRPRRCGRRSTRTAIRITSPQAAPPAAPQ